MEPLPNHRRPMSACEPLVESRTSPPVRSDAPSIGRSIVVVADGSPRSDDFDARARVTAIRHSVPFRFVRTTGVPAEGDDRAALGRDGRLATPEDSCGGSGDRRRVVAISHFGPMLEQGAALGTRSTGNAEAIASAYARALRASLIVVPSQWLGPGPDHLVNRVVERAIHAARAAVLLASAADPSEGRVAKGSLEHILMPFESSADVSVVLGDAIAIRDARSALTLLLVLAPEQDFQIGAFLRIAWLRCRSRWGARSVGRFRARVPAAVTLE